MQPIIVSMSEAHARLPELIGRIALGHQVVIAECGRWVASLTAPPPMPPTPEEEAALLEKRKAIVREWSGLRTDAPVPPPEGMGMDEYLAKYQVRK